MKILHLLSSNKYSGAENVVCQIIKMFESEVEMVYCSPNGAISKELKDRNVRYLPIENLSKKYLKKIVDNFKPDIIHAHDLRACMVASTIKNVFKVAHIHVNHPKMRKVGLRSILANHILKKFNKILWVSDSCLQEFVFRKNFINSNSIILTNIISLKNLEEKSGCAELKDRYDVVYCGRICEQKNPVRLVEICKMLVERKEDIKIAIIGDGDMLSLVNDKIEEYQLVRNVKLFGFVSNPLGIIKNSKIMILTSYFEGTPMTALESMGLGVPIVSTRTDGMETLIKNNINGYLYDSNEECCTYIFEILNDDKLLKKIKKTTIEFAKEYNDVSIYKNKLKGVYNLNK